MRNNLLRQDYNFFYKIENATSLIQSQRHFLASRKTGSVLIWIRFHPNVGSIHWILTDCLLDWRADYRIIRAEPSLTSAFRASKFTCLFYLSLDITLRFLSSKNIKASTREIFLIFRWVCTLDTLIQVYPGRPTCIRLLPVDEYLYLCNVKHYCSAR